MVVNPENSKGEIKPRTIEVFSTDDELIRPPNGKSRNTMMLKDVRKAQQDIPIVIQAANMGQYYARVNCVDVNSREVIDSFLFNIQAEKPVITRTETLSKIFVNKGDMKFSSIKFAPNLASGQKEMFSISSSNSKLLKPVKQFEDFEGKRSKAVEVVVPTQA